MSLLWAVLVAVSVGFGAVGLVALGVRLIRWARRNRARAAEGLLGVYEPSFGSGVRDWLGDWFDSLNESPSVDAPGHGGHHDGGGGHHDAGHATGCEGGDTCVSD